MTTAKKSQSELITTVLLILISITAVVIVSAFVINMVRNNLKGTDCFQTTGQLKIDTDITYTYFDTVTKLTYVRIERGEKDFNLSGMNIVYSNNYNSKKVSLVAGASSTEVKSLKGDGTEATTIELPGSSETKAYKIYSASSGIDPVNRITIEAVIGDNSCGKIDEQPIKSKP